MVVPTTSHAVSPLKSVRVLSLPPLRQVARLFDSLSASSAVACSQVLCVSHNAAFQQLCSRVVRLTRGAAGTMPADGGGKAGAVAGRSKKRRNA